MGHLERYPVLDAIVTLVNRHNGRFTRCNGLAGSVTGNPPVAIRYFGQVPTTHGPARDTLFRRQWRIRDWIHASDSNS